MHKHLPFCLMALLGVLQVSQGDWAQTELYPSCIGTGFPNFSYAKGMNSASGASLTCLGVNTQYQPPPVTMTWYYYDSYPPPPCRNPNLPDGDQCCHSTASSTITWYNTVIVNGLLGTIVTLTGNVTAGAFLGQSVAKTFPLDLATVNLNCGTAYGQEARVGTPTITIANGPTCLNGAMLVEYCPGSH